MSPSTVVLKVRRINGGMEDVLIDEEYVPLLRPGYLKILHDNLVYVQRYMGRRDGKPVRCSFNAARLILGLPHNSRELQASHTNRNLLDLRRCNLRALTPAHKAQNRGVDRYKLRRPGINPARNVNWDKRRERWRAACVVNGVTKNLGNFTDHEEAVAVTAAWRAENMPYATPLDRTLPVPLPDGPALSPSSRRPSRQTESVDSYGTSSQGEGTQHPGGGSIPNLEAVRDRRTSACEFARN